MSIREGFETIRVYCLGHDSGGWRCRHHGQVPLGEIPRKRWQEVGGLFRCTECGSVGYVHLVPNWSDVMDYSKVTPVKK